MPKPTTTPAEAPAPKRRRADAERSVAAILDAGLEALASDPDSSMSEIARRAGVVRATIYVHFPTRTALLDAVMEHATAQVVEAMRGAEPQRGEPVAGARASAPSHLAATRAVPRPTRAQHRPALGGGAPPPPRPHARPDRAPDRTRPETGRLPERSPRRLAPRSDPRDRAHRQRRNPSRPNPGIRSRGRDAEHGHLSSLAGAVTMRLPLPARRATIGSPHDLPRRPEQSGWWATTMIEQNQMISSCGCRNTGAGRTAPVVLRCESGFDARRRRFALSGRCASTNQPKHPALGLPS